MNEVLEVNNSTPLQSPPVPSSHQKINAPMILGVLILLLAIAVGSYYLGTRQNKTTQTTQQFPSPTVRYPTELPTVQPTSQPVTMLPSGWSYKESKICNVKIPLPSKNAPAYADAGNSDRFWQFEEYEGSIFMFTTTSRVIYKGLNEASGYVEGYVEVICSPNNAGYTTQTLVDKLESDLASNATSEESVTVKSKINETMWGQNVVTIKFNGGMFDSNSDHYIFATNKNIYLIRRISNQTEKNTTDKIFENLQFLTN